MEKYSSKAIASMILGIISVVCIWFGYSTIIGIICGVIGLVFAIQIRKASPIEGFKPDNYATADLF